MTRAVKLPDPLYERAKEQAEERDISIGAVIDYWYRRAEACETDHIIKCSESIGWGPEE